MRKNLDPLNYTCCSVAALDSSMTELGYHESVNRGGVNAVDIGMAVMQAVSKLPDPADVGQVIIKLNHDT